MTKLSRSEVAHLGGVAIAQKDGGRYMRELSKKASKTAGRKPLPTIYQMLATREGREQYRKVARSLGLTTNEIKEAIETIQAEGKTKALREQGLHQRS